MKRLITNKKYDIQGAKLIAEYNNTIDTSVPESYIEELYLKSGDYFIYGRGGAKTWWSDGNRIGSEGIKRLTTEEARAWINQHSCDKKKYADLFGEAEE